MKAGDFAIVNPDEKRQHRNKGDQAFNMICGVLEELSLSLTMVSLVRCRIQLGIYF